jgi:hypothetical protein
LVSESIEFVVAAMLEYISEEMRYRRDVFFKVIDVGGKAKSA